MKHKKIFLLGAFFVSNAYAAGYECMLAGSEVVDQKPRSYVGKEIWSSLYVSNNETILKDEATKKTYQGKLKKTDNDSDRTISTFCGIDQCYDYGIIFMLFKGKSAERAPMVVLNTLGIDKTTRYYNCGIKK